MDSKCALQSSDWASLIGPGCAAGVPRNLLVRFMNDSLDETMELDAMMQDSAGPSRLVDVTVRTLPGDHARPCRYSLIACQGASRSQRNF